MIRNTAREIAVHLAYELSFTDKTVKELLDERLTKEYFDTLKDEDNIYEKPSTRPWRSPRNTKHPRR